LALVVHGAFFALLYFGISWRSEPPQGMVVDIWESLPAPRIAPATVEPTPVAPPEPVEAPKVAAPRQPVVPPKADIELAEKKKPKIKPPEIKQPVQPEKIEPAQVDPKVLAEQAARAEQERARAEQVAAIGRVVDEHKARIIAKIRRNIVMPPDVPDNARAEFDVTLLPGGSVLNARLTKPSGNDAYDSAVERAILKSQPLPLPADVALFNKFRELHLIFSPKE
jgi:colicin import membrane protein